MIATEQEVRMLTGKARYKLVADAFKFDGIAFVVEVDHARVKYEELKLINDFWSGAEAREADYGVLEAVLRMLAVTIMTSVLEGRNLQGVIREFTHDHHSSGIEGWPAMDGSQGWLIVSVDDLPYDSDDFSVEAL